MNHKKNILVIITTKMAPYDGLTTVAMNYYRRLDLGMFHVDFASTNDIGNAISKELEMGRSRYIKLPRRASLAYMIALYKLLKKYDVVHIHGNSATTTIELLPAVLSGINKRIVHIHNTTCSHMTIHRLLKPVFDRCYTDAIACSRLAGEWIFIDRDFIVLNNAIELEKYRYEPQKRERIRRRYRLEDTSFVIGHVGRFDEQKNHDFLLDVFNEILKVKGQAKLMLVGDGRLRKEIEMKALRLQIMDDVIFCGMQDDAKDFFSAFDYFVFPSLWEGLPLALLEAQANGLNCLISDTISTEAEMTEGMQRLSLAQDAGIWAEFVTDIDQRDRTDRSIHYRGLMRECGYDIKRNVSTLENLYLC